MGRKRFAQNAPTTAASATATDAAEPLPLEPFLAAYVDEIAQCQPLVRESAAVRAQLEQTVAASVGMLRAEGAAEVALCRAPGCQTCSWASTRKACSMCAAPLKDSNNNTSINPAKDAGAGKNKTATAVPVAASATAAAATVASQIPVFIPIADDAAGAAAATMHIEVCSLCSPLCAAYLVDGAGLAASDPASRRRGLAAFPPTTLHLLFHASALAAALYAFLATDLPALAPPLADGGAAASASLLLQLMTNPLCCALALSAAAWFVAVMRDTLWLIRGTLPSRVLLANVAATLAAAAQPMHCVVAAAALAAAAAAGKLDLLAESCTGAEAALTDAATTVPATAAVAEGGFAAQVLGRLLGAAATTATATVTEPGACLAASSPLAQLPLLTLLPLLLVLVDNTALALRPPRAPSRTVTAAAPALAALVAVAVGLCYPGESTAVAVAVAGACAVIVCDVVRGWLDALARRCAKEKVRKTPRKL